MIYYTVLDSKENNVKEDLTNYNEAIDLAIKLNGRVVEYTDDEEELEELLLYV